MNVNKVVLKIVKLGLTTVLALFLVYFTVSITGIAFDFGYRVFTEPAMEEEPGADVAVTVDEDMDALELGKELERKGLVRDGNLFFIQLKLSAYSEKIRPGTYILNTSMEPKDMMVAMSASGKLENSEEETEETKNSEETTETEKNTTKKDTSNTTE